MPRVNIDLVDMYKKQIDTINGQIEEIETCGLPLLSDLKIDPNGPLRLNLACGNHSKRGYINVDILKFKGIDAIWDVTFPLPFAANTVLDINFGNSIKHVKMSKLKKVIGGLVRVLKPGGFLAITFYDFGLITDHYRKGLLDIGYINTMLYGAEFKENQIHCLIMDERWLKGVMGTFGCIAVGRKSEKWVVSLKFQKTEQVSEETYNDGTEEEGCGEEKDGNGRGKGKVAINCKSGKRGRPKS